MCLLLFLTFLQLLSRTNNMSESFPDFEDVDDNDDYDAEQYFDSSADDDLGVETLDSIFAAPLQNPHIELVILLAKGNPVAHVSKIEFETVAKPIGVLYNEVELCKGAQFRQYNYDVDAPVLHFLAHWIRYRNPSTAIKYALGDKVSNDNDNAHADDSLDENQRLFLVELINFFANEDVFQPVIKDSLISCFAKCLIAQDQKGKIVLAEVLKNAFADNIFKHIATDIFVALLN
ncbi:hypothetical protein D6D28_10079 [Aureobasidium pullulans]|uniref:Uncharacterized protein n=1 Tax=Aureobasidium pullulans TaxID=5580 RepID=A0A4S8RZ61_AURPU|nr:hypothetical protein D6D28_10079 [Aureobasidium pullulans]